MKTNHPANGPVSLDRLHQISEILSKAAAQSDGGNLGYAMADAVKVIDGVLEARNSEPVGAPDAWLWVKSTGYITAGINRPMYETQHSAAIPLYAVPPAPQAPVVPDEMTWSEASEFANGLPPGLSTARIVRKSWNACRAAMLQAGNSPVTPDGWIPVSERMPERDIDVQVYCADKKEQMVGYLERNEAEGWFRFASLPNGGGVYCKPTHWMPLPAAPQQEVKK